MIGSRKYNKKIEVWQTTRGKDEFGDSLITPTLLTKTWCNIVTPTNVNSSNRSTEFGLTDTSNRLVLKLRKRSDITYNSKNIYFIYRSEVYNIISEPINVNFEDSEIQITVEKVPNNRVFEVTNGQGNQHQHQHQNGQGGN